MAAPQLISIHQHDNHVRQSRRVDWPLDTDNKAHCCLLEKIEFTDIELTSTKSHKTRGRTFIVIDHRSARTLYIYVLGV